MKKQLLIISYQSPVKKILGSRFPVLGLLLFTVHCLLITASSASTADSIVEKIQNKYSEIQDMQGKFSQISYIKDLDRVETYEGEFFIKKPSNMKWAYSEPRDEEITISGTDTWIYKKSKKQVLKTAFSKDAYGQVPIALLGSLGDLKNDFDIIMIKENMLELRPKRQMGLIQKILLEASSQDFPIKTFSIFDIYGNKILIAVKNVKINSGLKDSFFIFKAPPGVETFDLNP